MKTFKIEITDIIWSGDDADQIPTTFTIEEDVESFEDYTDDEGETCFFSWIQDWLDYNGSKWGVTPEDFDFDLVD